MGKAQEWLSPEALADIAKELLRDPEEHGNRIVAWCPWHTETSKGGFNYNPKKDVCECFSCGEKTDIIGLFALSTGRGTDDGEAFVEFRRKYAPHVAGEAKSRRRTATSEARLAAHGAGQFSPRDPGIPESVWQAKAGKFVQECHDALMNTSKLLDWIQQTRGLTPEAVERFRVGINIGTSSKKDLYRTRESWGLPTALREDGKKKKLWLPRGIALPVFDDGGKPLCVRIRRPNTELKKNENKFYFVPGGCDTTWMCGSDDALVWVVVEAELDGMLLAQVAPVGVGVMALKTVRGKPTVQAFERLREAKQILYAMDCDQYGVESLAWWQSTFPGVVERWPVPAGKDPGEAHVQHGVDLSAWIIAGIAPGLRIRLFGDSTKCKAESGPLDFGSSAQGGGKVSCCATDAGDETGTGGKVPESTAHGPTAAEIVELLGEVDGGSLNELRTLVIDSGAEVWIYQDGGMGLDIPEDFTRRYPERSARLHALFWQSAFGDWYCRVFVVPVRLGQDAPPEFEEWRHAHRGTI
ncbi:hypothetical protein [Desulfovibrio inopinatus]|uniref:hypothetical protein n=1 Tax=Desulfovibrio inopinatus TaxID=102109 RepID=UPI000685F07E|nr:hypothetical protein [Desulfovibrio inopinatus]